MSSGTLSNFWKYSLLLYQKTPHEEDTSFIALTNSLILKPGQLYHLYTLHVDNTSPANRSTREEFIYDVTVSQYNYNTFKLL